MPPSAEESNPIVVAAAMTLSKPAMARLSEILGTGYLVLDIRAAPATANVVLTPYVSDLALGQLRGMFPQARILIAEVIDDSFDIHHAGPVTEAMDKPADGYFVAPTLSSVAAAIETQAHLQISGSRNPTPLQLPTGAPPEPAAAGSPTPNSANSPIGEPSGEPFVLWINGPFGGGKTTTATLVAEQTGWHLIDPEVIGSLLRDQLIREPVDDFQSWSSWRVLVAETVVSLVAQLGRPLVAPMSLLNEQWAREIFTSVALADITQVQVVLHASPEVIRDRAVADHLEPDAVSWRLDHIAAYEDAMRWLQPLATVIDTDQMTPDQVADRVIEVARSRVG